MGNLVVSLLPTVHGPGDGWLPREITLTKRQQDALEALPEVLMEWIILRFGRQAVGNLRVRLTVMEVFALMKLPDVLTSCIKAVPDPEGPRADSYFMVCSPASN